MEESKEMVKTNNKTKKRMKPIIKITIYLIFAIILIVFSFYQYELGEISTINNTATINYALSSKSDYKVYLNKNDYYKDEYLPSGMQYIANLIKKIDLNFNFEAHTTEKVDYEYKYSAVAKTLVMDKNDKSKILYEDKKTLLKEKKENIFDNNFVITETIPIDYNSFNDYIIQYKKEYSLNTSVNLIITVSVSMTGKSKISDEVITETKDFDLVIPLSEQTFSMELNPVKYENSGIINGTIAMTDESKALYTRALVFTVISIILLIRVLFISISNNNDKNIYTRTIKKYLREYDRAIVNAHKHYIDETRFEHVIRISSIEEMIDLHDNLQLPILYYDVIKGEKSYFIIIKDSTLYKLTISRKWLEKNSGEINEKKDEI